MFPEERGVLCMLPLPDNALDAGAFEHNCQSATRHNNITWHAHAQGNKQIAHAPSQHAMEHGAHSSVMICYVRSSVVVEQPLPASHTAGQPHASRQPSSPITVLVQAIIKNFLDKRVRLTAELCDAAANRSQHTYRSAQGKSWCQQKS